MSEVNSILDYIEQIAKMLASIDSRLASQSQASGVSSVEIKTSTRGVDITTKVYAGCPITEAGDAAMDEFMRVGMELNKRLGVGND